MKRNGSEKLDHWDNSSDGGTRLCQVSRWNRYSCTRKGLSESYTKLTNRAHAFI